MGWALHCDAPPPELVDSLNGLGHVRFAVDDIAAVYDNGRDFFDAEGPGVCEALLGVDRIPLQAFPCRACR